MFNVFVVAAYALLCVALGLELNQIFAWHVIPATLAAVTAFALIAQLHALTSRGAEKRRIANEFHRLEKATMAMRAELDATRRKMADVGTAFARRGDEQEKKVLGELQIIEGLIREFTTSIAVKSAEIVLEETDSPIREAQSNVPAIADPQLLELIRHSLEENRVDLYLQPTVSLPQRKVRFYEALSRLRSEDGTVIMPAQYIKVAAPAGLMSVVDNLLLFRCVQIMRRITQKRRDIGVFCNISEHTLTDAEFFPQFLDYLHHNRDLAGQIVFEFTQETVAAADSQQEASLKYLSSLGFQLSMDQVTSLDADFARLKALGFNYIKVKPTTLFAFVDGAKGAAEAFKRTLGHNGINLIVERIEDESTVTQLAPFSIDYGQGYLFGEPKPIGEMTDTHDARSPLATVANVTFLSQPLARRVAG